ncbi:MAG: hypothetical protein QXP60_05760 [Nitrososphaerota archaeon]
MFYIFAKNKDKKECICIAGGTISLILVDFLKDFFKGEYEIEYTTDLRSISSIIKKD